MRKKVPVTLLPAMCTQEVIRCQSGQKPGMWLLKMTITVPGSPQNQPTGKYYSFL